VAIVIVAEWLSANAPLAAINESAVAAQSVLFKDIPVPPWLDVIPSSYVKYNATSTWILCA